MVPRMNHEVLSTLYQKAIHLVGPEILRSEKQGSK